jgi:hypothetical protein
VVWYVESEIGFIGICSVGGVLIFIFLF